VVVKTVNTDVGSTEEGWRKDLQHHGYILQGETKDIATLETKAMPTSRHCNTTANFQKRTYFPIYTIHVVQKITIIRTQEIRGLKFDTQ